MRAAHLAVRSAALAAAVVLAACTTSSTTDKLDLGGDCQGDSNACQSGLCYEVDTGTSICTEICAGNGDCPEEMLCDTVPRYGKVCLPTGLGGRCRTDDECPAGHRCDTDASRCFIPVSRELCSPCTSPRQCPEGGTCLTIPATGEEYCTVACTNDTCPGGFTCEEVEGVEGRQCLPDNEKRSCNAGKGLCSPCRGDVECGGPDDFCVRNLASDERFCGTSCRSDSDCPSSFACQDVGRPLKQCVPNARTCASFCDSDDAEIVRRQCGLGASCDTESHSCQPASDGRLCAACEDDDQCAGAGGATRCVVNKCTDCPYAGEKFCASECTGPSGSQGGCPTGFMCVGLGSGGSAPFNCVPSSGTCRGGAGVQGDDCTAKGPAACLTGICLGFGAQSVCSATCARDTDCGDARYKCCAVTGEAKDRFDCSQAPGSDGGVCSPRGGSFGADCSPGQPPCFQGTCLDLGTARLCTLECPSGTTCPEGFGCRNARRPKGDGTYESIPVCFPDGGGDLGADCSFGPAACRSGYCIKKSSGNICTFACGDAAPCPEGYSCTETKTVDAQDLQACIPDDL